MLARENARRTWNHLDNFVNVDINRNWFRRILYSLKGVPFASLHHLHLFYFYPAQLISNYELKASRTMSDEKSLHAVF